VTAVEAKVETMKDMENKRHEQIKEYVNRARDMLESRVN
jgi:hypothetical protein